LSIISRHREKISKFISEPDNGIYDAMNKGIALSSGDIVGFLNADDVFADDGVLRTIADVFKDKEIDACYADLIYVDKHDPTKIVRYWKSRPYCDGLFEKGWMPAHPTFYAKRRVYEKYGGYDLVYRRQSDFELTLRFLAVNKIKSVYIP
jgi:glycosyltransferase involved in cell wall biosynthesis